MRGIIITAMLLALTATASADDIRTGQGVRGNGATAYLDLDDGTLVDVFVQDGSDIAGIVVRRDSWSRVNCGRDVLGFVVGSSMTKPVVRARWVQDVMARSLSMLVPIDTVEALADDSEATAVNVCHQVFRLSFQNQVTLQRLLRLRSGS